MPDAPPPTSAAPAGVWAAIPTPFDVDGRVAEVVFRENIRRLHAAGVHGVYTTDADGEFYALELGEFKRLVDVLADETVRLGLPCQAGVSWSSTAGVVARLRHCARRGLGGAHVGHPIYMEMTDESWLRFWDDVQEAVPAGFGLVHYNTPKMPNYLAGGDYARLVERVPGLVGTKYVGADVVEFAALVRHAPMLSHFVGEQAWGFLAPYGARGIYSWFVNINPRFMLEWYADALAGAWSRVFERQIRMLAFIELADELVAGGHQHGAIAKAMMSVGGFLLPSGGTRRPYLPIPEDTVRRWANRVAEEFPDMLWRP